jgi:hypothetical protein
LLFLTLPLLIFAQDTNVLQKRNDSTVSEQEKFPDKDSVQKDSGSKAVIQKKIAKKDSVGKFSVKSDSLKNLAIKSNVSDSLKDTLKHDSTQIAIQKAPIKKILQRNNAVQLMPGSPRNAPEHDIVFYILIFLLFFLGLIKTSFPKYVNSIFSLSFQATFRQTQIKEQMAQNFFPAFMLNVLFVLCGGLFITLFAEYNHWATIEFWQLFVYSTAILLLIYLAKYIVISFTGWVFNTKDAAMEYRFVVFLINKLLGIILLPLLFLIAYADNKIQNISITIVICIAVFSLAIRYLVSLARIRKNLSITAFHFFIYLCAVEIMPLLVIYKVLFLQTSNR